MYHDVIDKHEQSTYIFGWLGIFDIYSISTAPPLLHEICLWRAVIVDHKFGARAEEPDPVSHALLSCIKFMEHLSQLFLNKIKVRLFFPDISLQLSNYLFNLIPWFEKYSVSSNPSLSYAKGCWIQIFLKILYKSKSSSSFKLLFFPRFFWNLNFYSRSGFIPHLRQEIVASFEYFHQIFYVQIIFLIFFRWFTRGSR